VARPLLESYAPVDDDTRRVLSMMHKLLQRGNVPPVHPETERLLAAASDVDLRRPPQGECLGRPAREVRLHSLESGATILGNPVDTDLQLDSDEEVAFVADWMTKTLGPKAVHFVVPQAPVDQLVMSRGGSPRGTLRRADFLINPPGAKPFVVEIDGRQHEAQRVSDEVRDNELRTVGFPVIRVPAEEMRAGTGSALEAVMRSFGPLPVDLAPDERLLAAGPAQVHRAVLALLEAVAAGFLAGDQWVAELQDPLGLSPDVIRPYLDVLAAVDQLWAGNVAPRDVTLYSGEQARRWVRTDGGDFQSAHLKELRADVRLRLEVDRSPNEAVDAEHDGLPSVVVRSARLPVELLDNAAEPSSRLPARGEVAATARSLRVLLQALFAKEDFRDGQLEAVLELLAGRDCVVLLPTGAGKSLVYQMAGLCLPGRTLVVDPIVALIDDQREGLAHHGIDRTVGITSATTAARQAEAALEQVRSGDALFFFIAPERLQQKSFRDALRQLSISTPINLAVIDEAHCVSEWGHDFRTSYLRLGSVLRETCQDPSGRPPPLVALTGTASRAVLRDVLLELEIESRSENTIVRPTTFDRPELIFEVVRADPRTASAALKGAVQSLSRRFALPPSTFFRSRGEDTASGLVFCPHVNGAYGVVQVAQELQPIVGATVPAYAGSAPRGLGGEIWELHKQETARRFKQNKDPLLVATKAFGMGIDKANIRYVVHYGIPGSIESYYQEVGRAGRDRLRAECILVFSEYDAETTRQMLEDDVDLASARQHYDKISRSGQDDVARMLFFHLRAFTGIDEELSELARVVHELASDASINERGWVELRFGSDGRERALHRLVLLGVVSDYLKDWSRRVFEVELAGADAPRVDSFLLRFIERSQPGRAASLAQRLEVDHYEKLHDHVLARGRVLIEFVYETIERSRRRSLREMWLSARDSANDAEFRQRILDFLAEGDVVPVLAALAEQDTFYYDDWAEHMRHVRTPADAAEWRGAAARLLASYPDHPGLLLARGFAELLTGGPNYEDFRSNLEMSVDAAANRYGVTKLALERLSHWLIDELVDRELETALVVTLAVVQAQGIGGGKVAEIVRALATREPTNPAMAALYLEIALAEAMALESRLRPLAERWLP
jgi:ATP-dependent DNA helicase RecQ